MQEFYPSMTKWELIRKLADNFLAFLKKSLIIYLLMNDTGSKKIAPEVRLKIWQIN